MAVPDFPVKFENPLFGIFGAILGVIFLALFSLSYKRLKIAERSLELVKWQWVRRLVVLTNVGMKISVVIMLSFLLATPYFTVTVEKPVEELPEEQLAQWGVTIILLFDVSYSMNYSDLKPTRLQVAKQIAVLLVNNFGTSDQVGFMSFAGEIYDTLLPTSNRSQVTELINRQFCHPATAIGTALQTALGALETYPGEKTIVLLSDGKNNKGIMNLTSIGEAAATLKIPVFTVFLGTYGVWEADPIALETISSMSGGKFYEVGSEDIEALVTEVSAISREVKIGTMKIASDRIRFESKDYHTPLILFAALLFVSLLYTWFTGV